MEEDFIRRVLKASVVMMALLGLCGFVYLGPLWAFSFILIAAWSIVNLWLIAQLFTVLMREGSRLKLFVIFFLKVPVLYGLILTYLIAVPWLPSALIGGFALPYAVIVLKALGHSLVETTGRQGSPEKAAGAEKNAEQGALNDGRDNNDAHSR